AAPAPPPAAPPPGPPPPAPPPPPPRVARLRLPRAPARPSRRRPPAGLVGSRRPAAPPRTRLARSRVGAARGPGRGGGGAVAARGGRGDAGGGAAEPADLTRTGGAWTCEAADGRAMGISGSRGPFRGASPRGSPSRTELQGTGSRRRKGIPDPYPPHLRFPGRKPGPQSRDRVSGTPLGCARTGRSPCSSTRRPPGAGTDPNEPPCLDPRIVPRPARMPPHHPPRASPGAKPAVCPARRAAWPCDRNPGTDVRRGGLPPVGGATRAGGPPRAQGPRGAAARPCGARKSRAVELEPGRRTERAVADAGPRTARWSGRETTVSTVLSM
ncbi:hypothetical protein DFJ74DRAFT_715351, partial [Hyaloraphidium curvatum]